MNVLFVHPVFPMTYWGFQHSLPFIRKRATLPPLGLLTVAALLPPAWDIRVADLNVKDLSDDEILWADAVLVGGMLVQSPSALSLDTLGERAPGRGGSPGAAAGERRPLR